MINSIRRSARRFLSDSIWLGIGVIIAMLALASSVATCVGNWSTDAPMSVDNTSEERPVTGSTDEPLMQAFSVEKRVRCPGGGDWLGRERNRRDTTIEFRADPGKWIGPATIEVIAEHYGNHRGVKYDWATVEGEERRVRAHAEIFCDPPDYPGAPGGWMEVRLKSG